MKNIIIRMSSVLLLSMLLSSQGYATKTTTELIINDISSRYNVEHMQTIYNAEGLEIIEIKTKDGVFIYKVIASIATVLLPEFVQAVCKRTIGDEKACSVAYEATSMLVSMRGKRIYEGITKGIRWVANRGSSRSKVTIETSYYNMASNVKDALEVYKKIGCVKWGKVNINNLKLNKVKSKPYTIRIKNNLSSTIEVFIQYRGLDGKVEKHNINAGASLWIGKDREFEVILSNHDRNNFPSSNLYSGQVKSSLCYIIDWGLFSGYYVTLDQCN